MVDQVFLQTAGFGPGQAGIFGVFCSVSKSDSLRLIVAFDALGSVTDENFHLMAAGVLLVSLLTYAHGHTLVADWISAKPQCLKWAARKGQPSHL
jgi:hypothetical protein